MLMYKTFWDNQFGGMVNFRDTPKDGPHCQCKDAPRYVFHWTGTEFLEKCL